MVAAIAAALKPNVLAGGVGEGAGHLQRDRLGSRVVEHCLCPFGVGAGLIPDCLETVDAVFQRRIVNIGNARLNGVIEPLEAQFRFGGALVEFGDMDMLAAALALFLPAVEDVAQDGFQPLGP
ncbi:hypothetical protein [Blastochloris viridis]|uniref:Uncharacterized protein n=1 Tax=Blastochloris viridis TaxID=1079 RepID=A0A0P0JKG0_BLAVI|nr:hypothetical protein [Blastochloris viridis]ALK09716.1 hypothetical protein BVIR_1945 [Blastochloris viridis]CUU42379.1 hypothetical protein BVIRIDIS_13900 [Blastochloris viridis]